MKRIILFFFLIVTANFSLFAQGEVSNKKYTVFLTGASFASSANGWFELGCERLNAIPVNRAIGGHAIANTANMMSGDTLYTKEELEQMDAFVIMHVHDRNVFDPTQLKEKYTDYTLPFDRSNYAAAYDYVIKKYITDCYNLKFCKESEYYNSESGKPPVIVLCTHWHDARTIYNQTVRELAAKWGFPLVEFDKYIGFSKNMDHPVTGEPFSMLYATDKQEMGGVIHGFHPERGKDKYIQRRMAAIFTELMRHLL